MEHRPVIIVGAGPAGTATALYLQRHEAALAAECLVLDKAQHPRDKVCAGGLIPHTLDCLRDLDLALDVPHAKVSNAEVRVPGTTVDYRGRDLCRVIRRSEFDAMLARACGARGVEVRGRQRVIEVRREGGRVLVETESETLSADVVVGADGSGSLVRRKLLGAGSAHTGRAIMCDVPAAATSWRGHEQERYDFNFLAVADRLKGYAWAFPCVIDGEPHVNVGVYSVNPEGAYLYELLRRECESLGADVTRVQAFPIHCYKRKAAIAAPGALLVGDAAGVDPLMGEGISFCFEYGRLAAEAIARQRAAQSNDFDGYAQSVRNSWMGKKLDRLGLATSLFYGPTRSLWFAIAARSRRAQELGIRWYNGVDGVDRMSLWQGLQLFRQLHAQ